MKMPMHLDVLASLAVFFFSLPCFAADEPDHNLKVVIIRHGEKPKKGEGLSCTGENRARELPEVLYRKFNKPDYIYVPALGSGNPPVHGRMFQTALPFATKHDLSINKEYAGHDYKNISESVLKKSGTVLMVWNHSYLPALVKNLGIDSPPRWHDNDFDSIWIITYPEGKAILSFDKEGLSPSSACNN